MKRKLAYGALGALTALALSLGGCSDDDTGATCGDGVIEGSESCDGSNLGTETCETQGFAGGTLACDSACGLDTSGCFDANCGNNIAEGNEDCDRDDLGDADCTDLGFSGGTLACNADCTYDDSGCNDLCGNGTLDDAVEACDGDDFGAETCQTMGAFDGGTLTCSTDCQTIDTSACCTDECATDGETSCNGDLLETCELQANGCLGLTSYDCTGDGQVCDDSGAVAVCADACQSDCTEVGATRCANNDVETCTDNAGCLTWQVTETCTAGSEVCLTPGGQATCVTSGGGDSCVDAEVVSGSVSYSGSDFTSDYTDSNDWGANSGCGTANGADAVFQVWLDVGQTLHYAENGGLDAVLRVLDTCDATSTCLESNDYNEDQVFVPTTAGYYWVVIESYYASPGSTDYDISIEVLDDETDCGDGADNDMDGLTDCEDPNCFGDPTFCSTELDCSDGLDNDADGDTDCDDTDCAALPACITVDGLWQSFSASDPVDLADCTVAFTPSGASYQYTTTCGIGGLPIAAGTGTVDSTVLSLADSDSVEVALQGAWTIPFFGGSYGSIWVGSNGFVTFGAGDDYSDSSPSSLFAFPRIAGHDADLDPPSGGTITVDEFADYVVITFADVVRWSTTDTVSFQVVIHSSGDIEIHYGTFTYVSGGTVGLSNGGQLGTYPAETDFRPGQPGQGELVITEIMFNPSIGEPDGEWVEIYNAASFAIDLAGCTFQDNIPANAHTFGALVIPPGGYAVLTNNADPSANGGLTGTYAVGNAMQLSNGAGDIVTIICGGQTVAEVDFRGWSLGSNGTAIQLASVLLDETANDQQSSWCDATDTYGTASDNGTPGLANSNCGYVLLLSESFDTWIPSDWSVVDGADAGTTWGQCDGSGRTLNGATGTFACVDSDAAGSGASFDEELISPVMDLSSYSACGLTFLHYFNNYSTDQADVDASTDGGSTWTNLASYVADTANSEQVSLDISSLAGQSTVQIRFHYTSGWDFYWLIDDVSVICQ